MTRRLLYLIIFATTFLIGCVSTSAPSPYSIAASTYTANAQIYGTAYAKLDACAKTPACAVSRDEFRAAAQAVAAADTPLYAALQSWKATGAKPANYDALAAALSAAQTKVEVQASEVKP